MDTLARLKGFHSEQFEDEVVPAPEFQGCPIHEGFEFPIGLTLDEISRALQDSAKANGWVLIRKRSDKNARGEVIFKVLKCDHGGGYVPLDRSAVQMLPPRNLHTDYPVSYTHLTLPTN